MTSFSSQDSLSEDKSALSILDSINGTMINYYHVCPRKLWLFSRGLGREQDSALVELGRLVHEQSFPRQKHELSIFDRIKVDYTTTGDVLIVHEVKKTRSQFRAAHAQTLFYLYIMELLGVVCKGEIHYHSEKRRVMIELDNNSRASIQKTLHEIHALTTSSLPPGIPIKAPCSKCAYNDYCRM